MSCNRFTSSIFKEVVSVTLRNAHKENKRAKSERLFAHLLFLTFQIIVRVWVKARVIGLELGFGQNTGSDFLILQ